MQTAASNLNWPISLHFSWLHIHTRAYYSALPQPLKTAELISYGQSVTFNPSQFLTNKFPRNYSEAEVICSPLIDCSTFGNNDGPQVGLVFCNSCTGRKYLSTLR